MRDLMPHQNKALVYAKPLARIALFMQMRLGKSLVFIRWAEDNARKRVLIVAPLSVLPTWREELLAEEWAEEDIVTVRGTHDERVALASGPGTWFLINYDAIISTLEILALDWDCIGLDESTKIRNPQAEVTKALNSRTYHIPYKAILSGLPDPESPLDYFEQFRFLYGSFMHCGNYWYFRKRWFQHWGYEWVANGFAMQKIKEEVHRWAFVMTRKQAGLKDNKVYEKRFVQLNAEQRKLMKQIDEGFEYEMKDGTIEETKWIPVKYQWHAIIAGGFTPDGKLINNAKTEEICDLLKGELRDEPVIIWFRYNHELFHVSSSLSKKGLKVGTFIGSDKTGSERFKRGEIQVICAQGKCGMYGLDWSRSSTMFYYSNWYDGEVRAQTEDRIIHPKKDDHRLYVDFLSEGSIDEDVVTILREKKLNAKQFSMELASRWAARTKSR